MLCERHKRPDCVTCRHKGYIPRSQTQLDALVTDENTALLEALLGQTENTPE